MSVETWSLVFSIVALIIGMIAGVIGTAALATVIGLKNSTHQVVWKPLEPEKLETEQPFDEEEPEIINPNRRFKNEMPKDEEAFHDPTDPFETSNKF